MLCCFGFCAFGFEAYPFQVVISLLLWIKLTMVQLLFLFLCNFCSFFIYAEVVLISRLPTFFHCSWLIYFCYSANCNKRGAFVKIYLIHSDLLICLRSVGTIVITIKQPQSHFDWAIIHKRHHFLLFWCILCTTTPDIS